MAAMVDVLFQQNDEQRARITQLEDENAELRSQLREAHRAIKNALNFTRKEDDKAMWRVGAINALPEDVREAFYDRLSEGG